MDQTDRDRRRDPHPDDDLADQVQAALDQVRADVLARDYPEARRGMERVAEQLDAPGLATSARAGLQVQLQLARATVVGEADGDHDHAMELVTTAQQLVDDHDLSDLRARVLAQQSFVHQRRGEAGAALRQLEQAQDLLDTCPPRDALQILVNRGVLQAEVGSLEAAVEDFTRAERIARDTDHTRLRGMATHNLGWVAFLRGDLPAALESMHAAAGVTGDEGGGSIGALDRARVLTEAGLLDDADALLAEAIAALADGNRRRDEGEAHLARARVALVIGALDTARDEARAASTCFAAVDNQPWLRQAEMTRLATMVEVVAQQHDDPGGDASAVKALREQIDTLLATARAAGDDQLVIATRLMAAEVALVAKDVDTARRHVTAVELEDVRGVSMRMRWHRARATLAARDGVGARRVVADGMAELADQQAQLGSLDLRTAIAIHGRDLAGIGIDVALDSMDPDAIHATVEQAHASSTRMSPVRVVLDDRDRELLGRLRRATMSLDQADDDADSGGSRRARLQAEVDEVRARLRERGWQRRGDDPSAGIVDLASVQSALAARGAVAVTWVRRAGRLLAVVVDGTTLDVVDVASTAGVDAHVARVHSDVRALLLPGIPGQVRSTMASSLRTGLATLDEQFLQPLTAIDDRDLVMVPSGALALVPWPLVASRRGHATTMAPCLTSWHVAESRLVGRGRGIVALAGPRLQRAESEVAAVADTWPQGTAWSGRHATVERARDALQSSALVHLAMHGRHRESSPLFSSLDLVDGPLFAHEVTDSVVCDLVVLSACEVGASHLRPGDEPLGMTAALHQAGAGTVVAGVTPVRDQVAHDVMVDLHRELVAGRSPAAALGMVTAAAWDDGAPAPFTCVGAGLVPPAGASSGASPGRRLLGDDVRRTGAR